MADLIDREELLNKRVYSCRNGKFPYEKAYKCLISDIKNAPKADTERHAHWIYEYDEDEEIAHYICSNCNEYDYYEPKYCPDCGCRMDEEE